MPDPAMCPATKRQQIITGAEEVFTAHGYDGASMAQIADRAGVSKGTLYNYFTGKSELFSAFIREKSDRTLAHIFDKSLEEDASTEETLRQIAFRMIEVILTPSAITLYRIVVSEAVQFPHLAETFFDAGPKRALSYMSSWIERQVKDGRLVVPDPSFAAELFFTLCQTHLCLRARLQLPYDDSVEARDRIVDGAVTMFLRNFAPTPPSP